MIRKRIALLQRKPDMSFQGFDQHWATVHAQFITGLPGIREYVQNPVESFWTNGDPAATIDGVVEVWFDDAAVASPQRHTSTAQQDDEVRFIRTNTAFTVTGAGSYDAEEKVWVLSPELLVPAQAAALAPGYEVCVMEPERGSALMNRPRLLREPAAPALLLVYPVRPADSDALFSTVVATLQQSAAPSGVRVLRTSTRRLV